MEFTGRLGAVALPELLQWPHNERRSGALVVRTSRREKRVLFDHGEIVGCLSGDPAEYFGQHLLLQGHIERGRLVEALSLCRVAGVRLGTALVDLGLLPPDQLEQTLRGHVTERVCDLFLWQHGVFYFSSEMPEKADLLGIPLDPVMVAMEGARWADEHERIRTLLVHDGVVLRRAGEQPPDDLPVIQARIFDLLEQPDRLDALYERVQGSKFRFLEACYRLLAEGALEVERLEDDFEVRSEIRMFDLMLEQAATEEVMFTARHLSLPLDWFDRFFPLWVEGADGTAVAELPEDERSLFERMDGNRSLRELVLDQPGRPEGRMDLVLLQLQKGQLALLPRPLSELKKLGRGPSNPWLRRFLG
jgi:hypothetical protein